MHSKKHKVILIGAQKRVGKDYVGRKVLDDNEIKAFERSHKAKVARAAFADSIKADLDEILLELYGISAFVEDSKQKDIIRPFLIKHGETMKQLKGPDYWVKRLMSPVQPMLESEDPITLLITDWRFPEEYDYTKNLVGERVSVHTVCIRKEGQTSTIPDEIENEPKCWRMANFQFIVGKNWEGQDKIINKIKELILNT